MLDLLNKEVLVNDEVVYVAKNRQGKIVHKQGRVIGYTKNGVKVATSNGIIKVQNIIKLNKNISLLDRVKKLFKM